MSFRLKTVIGIAAIEIILLIVLIITSLNYLRGTNEQQLYDRAKSSALLIATMTSDSVVSFDLATLDALIRQVSELPGQKYIRILDKNGLVLSKGGSADDAGFSFVEDTTVKDAYSDGIFDVSQQIQIGSDTVGTVQLGFEVTTFSSVMDEARQWMLGLALFEVVLVAIFGMLLGTALTTQLAVLVQGARQVATGQFKINLPVKGRDEIAQTTVAFNKMSKVLVAKAEDAQNAITNAEKAAAKLKSYFDNSTEGIIVTDQFGKITDLNEQVSALFGYERSEIVGENVSMLIPDRHKKEHDDKIKKFLTSGKSKIEGFSRELVGKTKEGETIPIGVGVSVIQHEGETVLLATVSDMRKMKGIEEQLRQSRKMEAVGQLVGGIAHDFNNLLGITLGNLELISKKMEPESRTAKQLNKAANAAQRGATLTRKLLNFSRQMPAESDDVDVNETINDIIDFIKRGLTASIDVQLELNKALPLVKADRGDLEDVITNLCVNARDAMPLGGQIIIETKSTMIGSNDKSKLAELKPGPYVQICISDTGCGMPPEVLDRIFEPFYSTKERGKGTGLGLSMAYGFAKRSGGLISVYSEEGLGTTFNLYLQATERREIARNYGLQGSNEPEKIGTGKILIVDDEEDLLEIAETLLSETGYETVVAASGEEAVEILKADDTIDMIFSDVVMPGEIDGFKLVEIAKDIHPDIKVCLASGFTGSLSSKERLNVLNCRLLKKPYSNRELLSFIRENLDVS